MTLNKLSKCETLDQFNDFISQNVDIQIGSSIGRKFKIGDQSYSLNQIWQQYEKCLIHEKKQGKSISYLGIRMDKAEKIIKKLDADANLKLKGLSLSPSRS